MTNLEKLVTEFRMALDHAHSSGDFIHDPAFWNFPNGCCGDTCVLLGEYLYTHGIETDYVCGTWYGPNYRHQTHVWLVTKENLIIDITGDQFKDQTTFYNFDEPVYVGSSNSFYNLFSERNSQKCERLHIYSRGTFEPLRLPDLYDTVLNHMKSLR